ncbi:capsule biosynthesis GfcC family protein, partial [Bacillus pumilus]|uniref:capsule biosynthesis GfcC family protein n=1 Tax=Bacillus pumilus TaxID=1408 RepID=UPI003315681B
IIGKVLFATQIPFEKNLSFKSCIKNAGGFASDADKKNAYVIYANGKVQTTKRFLFIRTYPKIRPGAQVIVPEFPEKNKTKKTAAENIAIASMMASLAGVVVAIINSIK